VDVQDVDAVLFEKAEEADSGTWIGNAFHPQQIDGNAVLLKTICHLDHIAQDADAHTIAISRQEEGEPK